MTPPSRRSRPTDKRRTKASGSTQALEFASTADSHRRHATRRAGKIVPATVDAHRSGKDAPAGAILLDGAEFLVRPWQWLTAPRFYGLDHLPVSRPFLLVGNHTLFAVLDSALLLFGLRARLGLVVRPLGDHAHFRIPLWRELLQGFGVVDGSRQNCRALMRAGESILVFPGGGREVFKRRGEKYRLLWGNRIGFARLALEHGYPIVPFAAVGAEDCYDIRLDANDLLAGPLGPVVERIAPRGDLIPPLVTGVGFSPLPRLERFYFAFGKPILTRSLQGRRRDDAVAFRVRERTRRAVERLIAFLLGERERDPGRRLGNRLLAMLGSSGNGPLADSARISRPMAKQRSESRSRRPRRPRRASPGTRTSGR